MEMPASLLSYKLFGSLDSHFVCRAQIRLGYAEAEEPALFQSDFFSAVSQFPF